MSLALPLFAKTTNKSTTARQLSLTLQQHSNLTFGRNFFKSWLFRVGRLCLQPRRSSSRRIQSIGLATALYPFDSQLSQTHLRLFLKKGRSFHLTFDRNFPKSWLFHVGRFSLHPRRSSSGKVQSIGLVWRSTHSTHNFGTRSSYVHFIIPYTITISENL